MRRLLYGVFLAYSSLHAAVAAAVPTKAKAILWPHLRDASARHASTQGGEDPAIAYRKANPFADSGVTGFDIESRYGSSEWAHLDAAIGLNVVRPELGNLRLIVYSRQESFGFTSKSRLSVQGTDAATSWWSYGAAVDTSKNPGGRRHVVVVPQFTVKLDALAGLPAGSQLRVEYAEWHGLSRAPASQSAAPVAQLKVRWSF